MRSIRLGLLRALTRRSVAVARFRSTRRWARTTRGLVGPVGVWATIGIVSLLATAPLAAGTSGKSVAPPFHGLVVPTAGKSVSGCAKVRTPHPWSFDLKSGVARDSSSGVALGCLGSTSGQGLPASAKSSGSVQVTIPLTGISALTSTVVTNLSWNSTLSLNTSDGYSNGHAAPCSARANLYDNVTREHEWLFNATTYQFNASNVTSYDRLNHGRTTSFFYGPPTPTPFVRNKTNEFSFLHTYGAHGSCLAQSYVYVGVYAYIFDHTTSTYLTPTGNTVANSYGTIVSAYVQIENTTDWSCSTGSGWYGPANYSYKNPLTCTSNNLSTSAYVFAITKHTNSFFTKSNIQPWNTSLSGVGSFWWNSTSTAPTFSATDRYVLQLSTETTLGASNDWFGGYASWTLDLSTHNRGISLRSIGIF
jgi:hypothetical protein